MKPVGRRRFLVGAAAAALLPACLSARRRRSDLRSDVLASLVHRIAVPDTRRILDESAALERSIATSASRRSAANRLAARSAWRRAALAWERAYAFRRGPIVETNALLRATFWPARPDAIAAVITGSAAIDARSIDELGVDAKGIFALEHVLFEGPPEPLPTWLEGPHATRALSLARAIASDVRAHAERAATTLGDGDRYAVELGAMGADAMSAIVNDMIAVFETAAVSRVDRVMSLARDGHLRPTDVRGGPSGLSSEIVRTWLDVSRAMYAGGAPDLSTVVGRASTRIDRDVRSAFDEAIRAFDDVDAPLERVAIDDPSKLSRAVRALKRVEIALRTEVASALGVTLTFTSGDGD